MTHLCPPRWARTVALLLACCGLVVARAAPAHAKLEAKAWRALEEQYARTFAEAGAAAEKADLLRRIAADETGRAWRLLAEALFKEVELWGSVQAEIAQTTAEHAQLLPRGVKRGFSPDDEREIHELQARMAELDALLAEERAALAAVVTVVCEGPEILRKNVLQRARSGGDWPDRAAAMQVAVKTMDEKPSRAHVQRMLATDKDPRVRMAGLDALAEAPEGWEDLVIGRLGDPDWGVLLRAAGIIRERELYRAIPHLINALAGARPRIAEGIGDVLRSLTKENFDAYQDVWAKWWKDHQEEFAEDIKLRTGKDVERARVHLYGVEVRSDRVLFIVDISGPMKLATKNENPAEKWKPAPPTTGGDPAPPPPPPPEEILSGPKIDVAKHELAKAIKALPEDTTFNIIAFNQAAVSWNKGMEKASAGNKEEALKWVRALKPHGSTYIDGALRLGFNIAGLIHYDKRYPDIALDTIVLVSDGAPTDNAFPDSKLMDPEIILGHVREWNKAKMVVVHCIGVDMVEAIEFLQKLAAENGGTYVDR